MLDLFKGILNIIGWLLIIIGFFIYLRYQEVLINTPRIIIFLGIILITAFGLGLILLKSYTRIKRSNQETNSDRLTRITPLDEFKHDVIALLTGGLILLVVSLSKNSIGLSLLDFIQAGIGFLGVISLRGVYLKKNY